jgi:hypothetical protein
MSLSFAHKDWSAAAASQGIVVTLMNMHGDADAFTTHSRTFPLTEGGVAAAETLLRAFDHLSGIVSSNREACLEDICAKLSPKVGVDEEALCKMLDTFIQCDVQCDDYLAKPVAYRFSVTDADGTRYALYPGHKGAVRYKALASTHPSYFQEWA